MADLRADLVLIHAGQVATPLGNGPLCGKSLGAIRTIADGAVACAGGRILAVGTTDEVMSLVEPGPAAVCLEARGRLVTPGLVDPHTHALYAGSRQHELEMKLAGRTYLEILAAGGGILDTVRRTRAAPLEELENLLRSRLRTMLAHGATTVEVKTGYGLSVPSELAHLGILASLAGEADLPAVVPTVMAAHAVPEEWAGDPDGYLGLVCREILPRAAASGARFADVFCEPGVFSVEQARRVLQTAREYDLGLKLHGDELAPGGGAELAAEVGAISAEHLVHASPAGMRAMAEAGVIAVLLPGTSFYLAEGRYAPARAMVDAGVAVALGSDANPGTSPTENPGFLLNLACLYLRLTPAESLAASTLNAACAVGLGGETGTLEPGKRADILIFDAPDYCYLPYHYGTNLVHTVIKGGKVVWGRDSGIRQQEA
ncbi:MAG: imidazolonepropionase [Bacteroidota bacterium]